MKESFSVVDLFSGAGGMSLGFKRAGFECLAAYDNWQPAVQTYRANLGDRVQKCAVTLEADLPLADVIVGGPPCQGFSSAGLRREDDKRNTLVGVFAELVSRIRPTAFVFENVEGFLTAREGAFLLELLVPLYEAGYRMHVRKINAANYGVPQHRKRVIVVGGLGWDPTFPIASHAASGAPGAHLGNGLASIKTPSLGETISILPSLSKSFSIPDHTFTHLEGEDLARAQLLKAGQRMRDLPEEFWHKSYRKRAYRRVKDGTPTERRGGAPCGVRRLHSDQPSKAITGGALREFLHPTEHRPLTVRECALLQTFPIDFELFGSQSDRIQLIGNAVPPLLAENIALNLLNDLKSVVANSEEGFLLSFIPTLSVGMSPVLRKVTHRIEAHFGSILSSGQLELQWD